MKKRIDGAHGGTIYFEQFEDDAILEIENGAGGTRSVRVQYLQALYLSQALNDFLEMRRSKWPIKGDTK